MSGQSSNTQQMGKARLEWLRRMAKRAPAPAEAHGGPYGTYKDAVKIYEDGKHRRYSLLFAVNGAVAAIAKVGNGAGADQDQALDWVPDHLLFRLGMIVFTLLMFFNIWIFGQRIREAVGDDAKGRRYGTFSIVGKIVLGGCCALIIAGWAFIRSMPAFSAGE